MEQPQAASLPGSSEWPRCRCCQRDFERPFRSDKRIRRRCSNQRNYSRMAPRTFETGPSFEGCIMSLCAKNLVSYISPGIIFAQWNTTLAGCLMSPLCEDIGFLLGSMYHLRTVEQFPENGPFQRIALSRTSAARCVCSLIT